MQQAPPANTNFYDKVVLFNGNEVKVPASNCWFDMIAARKAWVAKCASPRRLIGVSCQIIVDDMASQSFVERLALDGYEYVGPWGFLQDNWSITDVTTLPVFPF